MTSPVVRLGTKEWIYLIGLIASASVANVAGLHKMQTNLTADMIAMDQRWQDRTEMLARDIKGDIAAVQASIPPDWFRDMVVGNQRKIEKLENELSQLRLELAAKKGLTRSRPADIN